MACVGKQSQYTDITNDNKAEQTNEVSKGRCTELYLESGSPSGFYAPCSFTAEHVQVNVPVAEDGQVLILPFDITPLMMSTFIV